GHPGAIGLRRALRDRERGTRSGHVEIEEVAVQGLQRVDRGLGTIVDEIHAVVIPRIARPAANSATSAKVMDAVRRSRLRTNVAASGNARARAKPYSTCSDWEGGRDSRSRSPNMQIGRASCRERGG